MAWESQSPHDYLGGEREPINRVGGVTEGGGGVLSKQDAQIANITTHSAQLEGRLFSFNRLNFSAN